MFTAYCGGRLTFKHECFGVAAVGVTAGGRLDGRWLSSDNHLYDPTPRFWRIFKRSEFKSTSTRALASCQPALARPDMKGPCALGILLPAPMYLRLALSSRGESTTATDQGNGKGTMLL
ncbi:unnamed protein product [Boreogadus saida]